MYLVNLLLWHHNGVTIFTYKLTPKHCISLSQVDSVYQNIAKSSFKYMKERLCNSESHLGILSLNICWWRKFFPGWSNTSSDAMLWYALCSSWLVNKYVYLKSFLKRYWIQPDCNGIYLFQFSNGSTRRTLESVSGKQYWRRSDAFIVNYGHISYLILVFYRSVVDFEQLNIGWEARLCTFFKSSLFIQK